MSAFAARRGVGHWGTELPKAQPAPALSPWLVGDMNPSMSHMCPGVKEHPAQPTILKTDLAQTASCNI